MYRHLQFTEYEDGSKGDSTVFFIHYRIQGDSAIAGKTYRIMVEEDLSLLNTDLGLVKIRSTYAVRADSTGLLVKSLRYAGQGMGRLPFKTAAGIPGQSIPVGFDSSHFQDEILALKQPLFTGIKWDFREPGSPYGQWPATKTLVGMETILLEGTALSTLKFQIEVENQEYIRTFEWYSDDTKVFSRSSSSITFEGKDSTRVEEEYLGSRSFTSEDTLAVLKGTILDPNRN
ncbi:MAG: hypothetical protein JWP91_3112 [Fibrobacteres bacterium]|nr:hypothetical protein [Fibrobacterota bacterium]